MDIFTVMCKHDSEAVPIAVHDGTCFKDFVSDVCDRWTFLRGAEIEFTYCLPQYDKCLLRNRDEFSGLKRIVLAYSLKLVHMEVKKVSASARVSDLPQYSQSIHNGMELCAWGSTSRNVFGGGSSSHTLNLDRPLLSSGWKYCLKSVGQVFEGGSIAFRAALVKYSVERGFLFYYGKNTRKNVLAYCKNRCSDEKCQWMVSASINPVNKFFVVKKFNNVHCCNATVNVEASKRLSKKVIAGLIADVLRDDSVKWAPNNVANHVQKSFGFEITYSKSWHALAQVKHDTFGDENSSYQQLIWYTRAAAVYNPNSHIILEKENDTNRFRRFFVAWGSCIKGFTAIRPMLFLDGTHLKGKYKGCLLAATGKNGNQELYPLAYAVVDAENQENWSWFLLQLKQVIDGRQITFVSDRNPGILDGLTTVFPESPHYYCLQHLKDNLRTKYCGIPVKGFKERMVQLFHDCAYASTKSDFKKCKEAFIREGGDTASNFIDGLPLHKWTCAYGVSQRYGEMTCNAAESFNAWILLCREMPITHMIDLLRTKPMVWFMQRKEKSSKWTGLLTEEMETTLHDNSELGRTWNYKRAGTYLFEVLSHVTDRVDLEERTCSCMKWQQTGFPCEHAVLCINRSKLSMKNYIEEYWYAESYRKSYAIPIQPIPTSVRSSYERTDDQKVLPPTTKRPPGRPKKARYMSRGEKSMKKLVRCSRCKQFGHHNKKTCKAAI